MIESVEKLWLESDKDIKDLYKIVKPENEMTQWCDGISPEANKSTQEGKIRKSDDSTEEPPSKHKAKDDMVDGIIMEIHGTCLVTGSGQG